LPIFIPPLALTPASASASTPTSTPAPAFTFIPTFNKTPLDLNL